MREMHRNRDRIELQLDNRQIVSFVIGSLVVLGVVFALGVMVGKQLAVDGATQEPGRPADPLAAIDAREKALSAAADAAVGTGELPAPKEQEPLTFAQELTRPKPVDPVIEPTRPAVPEKPAPRREEPAPEAKRAEPEPQAEPEAPEAPKRSGGLAAAFEKVAPKPASGGAFALQAASLPNRSDAEKMVSRLSGKGYSAYIVEAEIPGKGTYYRVKVGSFATRDDANVALADFKSRVGTEAIVTSAR